MSVKAKFGVGDWVWHATFESHEKWVKCPHCLGYKWAKVTFGDGSEVTVDCGGCESGYNPPSGVVRTYDHEAQADYVVVEGIEIHRSCQEGMPEFVVRYSLSNHRGGDEQNVFDNEQDAKERAVTLAQEWTALELKRLGSKDRPSRSWAQNASYHRRSLKTAQRDVEYHTSKLDAAKAHAKEKVTQ